MHCSSYIPNHLSSLQTLPYDGYLSVLQWAFGNSWRILEAVIHGLNITSIVKPLLGGSSFLISTPPRCVINLPGFHSTFFDDYDSLNYWKYALGRGIVIAMQGVHQREFWYGTPNKSTLTNRYEQVNSSSSSRHLKYFCRDTEHFLYTLNYARLYV